MLIWTLHLMTMTWIYDTNFILKYNKLLQTSAIVLKTPSDGMEDSFCFDVATTAQQEVISSDWVNPLTEAEMRLVSAVYFLCTWVFGNVWEILYNY